MLLRRKEASLSLVVWKDSSSINEKWAREGENGTKDCPNKIMKRKSETPTGEKNEACFEKRRIWNLETFLFRT